VVDIEVTVVVGVDDVGIVLGNLGFDDLDKIQQGYGVETVVGELMEADRCTDRVGCLVGSLSSLLDLRISSVNLVVA
jgi:hypothetical protein